MIARVANSPRIRRSRALHVTCDRRKKRKNARPGKRLAEASLRHLWPVRDIFALPPKADLRRCRGSSTGRSRATNETTDIKGQHSANRGMNVQEAIRFQTYYRTMLRAFRLSPLLARSS